MAAGHVSENALWDWTTRAKHAQPRFQGETETLNLVISRCCRFCRGRQRNVPKFIAHVQAVAFFIKSHYIVL